MTRWNGFSRSLVFAAVAAAALLVLEPLLASLVGGRDALRLFAGLPGIVLTEREDVGWLVGTTGPPGREILWTRFDEAACDEGIDAVLARIGAYCQGFDWAVYRTCRPARSVWSRCGRCPWSR